MRLDELIKAYISFFGFEPEKLTVQIEGGEALELHGAEKIKDFVYLHDNYMLTDLSMSSNYVMSITLRKWGDINAVHSR